MSICIDKNTSQSTYKVFIILIIILISFFVKTFSSEGSCLRTSAFFDFSNVLKRDSFTWLEELGDVD
ncbi:hypothetical protein BD408DRAFT_422157 [Parasitella parasitica]|nr:hypothetical protein BD408DRAFT_422157 [Parasitella parasitica]